MTSASLAKTSPPKFDQVADILHSTISLTALEKKVISTTLFNRLHNILQNSTLFFTFPACRTSRFIHSLGCMHIAGELFRASVVNGHADHVKKYFVAIREAIEALRDGEFAETSRSILSADGRRFRPPPDVLANRATPVGVDAESFQIMFQAVRLYGLLHDLAHPPFSHVTENALIRIYQTVSSKPEAELTEREKAFLTAMKPFSEPRPRDKKQLHEIVSHILIGEILLSIAQEKGETSQYALLFKHILPIIFDHPSSVLYSVHSLVDGDVDADRLDYTSRDLVTSGLGKALSSDRLINTFCLCRKGTRFLFLPSIRSLYATETLLAARFDLYRFGVLHHRVRKFDGLLTEVLVKIGTTYLATPGRSQAPLEPEKPVSTSQQIGEEPKDLLPVDISGLWHVLSPDILKDAPHRVATYYSQWDDAWLLNILRRELLVNSPISPLREQLTEILSNSKRFHPLFKRPECFREVDEAFVKAGAKELKDPSFWQAILADQSQIDEFAQLAKTCQNRKGRVPGKFFLTILEPICQVLGIDHVSPALAQLNGNKALGIASAFCVRKLLASGIHKEFQVLTENGPQDIDAISNIRLALEADATLFPPFFVFLLPASDERLNIPRIRRFLGRELYNQFRKELNNVRRNTSKQSQAGTADNDTQKVHRGRNL